MLLQNLKMRSATEVRFITSAQRMNIGIAISAKLLRPVNIWVPSMARFTLVMMQYSREEVNIEAAIGMPSRNKAAKEPRNTNISMPYASFSPRLAAISLQVSLTMLLTMWMISSTKEIGRIE